MVRTSIGTDDDIATLPLPFCCNHCTGCSPSLPRLVTTEVFLLQHKVSAALYLREPKEVHVHLEDLLQLQQLFLGELLEEGGGEWCRRSSSLRVSVREQVQVLLQATHGKKKWQLLLNIVVGFKMNVDKMKTRMRAMLAPADSPAWELCGAMWTLSRAGIPCGIHFCFAF